MDFYINMLDGEKIHIQQDTLLVGIVNDADALEEDGMFYSKQIYINTLDGSLGASALSTSSILVGAMGFMASCDFFEIGDDINSNSAVVYKASAVKSLSLN